MATRGHTAIVPGTQKAFQMSCVAYASRDCRLIPALIHVYLDRMGDVSTVEHGGYRNDVSYTSAYAIDAPVRISGSFARVQSPFSPGDPVRTMKLAGAEFSKDRTVSSAMTYVEAKAEEKSVRIFTGAVLRQENKNVASKQQEDQNDTLMQQEGHYAAPVFDSIRRGRLKQRLVAAEYDVQDIEREDPTTGLTMRDFRLTDKRGLTHDVRMGFETQGMYETWLKNKEVQANTPEDDPGMPPRMSQEKEKSYPLAVGVFSQPQELGLPFEQYQTYIQSHAAVLKDVFRVIE